MAVEVTSTDTPQNGVRGEIQHERLSRDEFINDVFVPHYNPGEHVALIGPTQSGKTTIAYQLLDKLATSELPAVVLVMKPRDQVVKDFSKLSGFKKTETWPPITQRGVSQKSGGFLKRRRGWVFWPRHSLDNIDLDDRRLERQFRQVLTDCYKRGDRIIFADEVVGLAKELHLEQELNAVWMRGASMGCGLWAATQRPFHAPLHMYEQSQHLILFNIPDARSRKRFEEISGVDPELVGDTVMRLPKHEFLYIGRTMADDGVSPAMAIVDAGNRQDGS